MGSVSLFQMLDMTCRNDQGNVALKSKLDCEANVLVLYVRDVE